MNTTTWRTTAITCRDVSGDGIPEIPGEKALPSYHRNGLEENLYLIEWSSFDGRSLTPVSYSFVDINEKFTVHWPEEWQEKVTVERSLDADRSFEFKAMESGKLLFTIRIYGNTEYTQELGDGEWHRLYTDSDHIYLVKCQPGNELGIDYLKVFGLFDVI